MKEKLRKIIKNLKKIAKWLFKNIKWIITAVGGFMIIMCVKNIVAKIGHVDQIHSWDKIPGDKSKVFVYTENGGRVTVTLPKDPRTNKQLKSDDIKMIGLPKNPASREDLHVEILHTPVNRR